MKKIIVLCLLVGHLTSLSSQEFVRINWKPLNETKFDKELNQIVKTNGFNNWGESGGSSFNEIMIGNSGEMRFRSSPNFTEKVIGFSELDNDDDPNSIEFAIKIDGNNEILVLESGTIIGNYGTISDQDELAIRKLSDGTIEYILNNAPIYIHSNATQTSLIVDFSLKDIYAEFNELKCDFNYYFPIIWSERQLIETNNASINSTIGVVGWGESGATSTNVLYANETGTLKFKADVLGKSRAIGLSVYNYGSSFEDITYGFLFDNFDEVSIIENGSVVGIFGHIDPNSQFEISKDENNFINYYWNDIPIFQSPIPEPKDLHVDCSFGDENALFYDIEATFTPLILGVKTPVELGVSYSITGAGLSDSKTFGNKEIFYPYFDFGNTEEKIDFSFYHLGNECYFKVFALLQLYGEISEIGGELSIAEDLTIADNKLVKVTGSNISFSSLLDLGKELSVQVCKKDKNKNYVVTKTFDELGDLTELNATFSNQFGNSIQQHSKSFSSEEIVKSYTSLYLSNQFANSNSRKKHLLASEHIYDAWQRPVIQTLAAPTYLENICLVDNFITRANVNYNYHDHFQTYISDISTELGIDCSSKGTLGWYYSDNNSEEDYVPASSIPFSRVVYDDVNFTGILKSTSPGEEYKLGSNHESQSYTIDHHGELQYIYGFAQGPYKKHIGITQPANIALSSNYTKTISIDPDGLQTVAFHDGDGKLLATCHAGEINTGGVVSNGRELEMSMIFNQGYIDVHLCKGMENTLRLTTQLEMGVDIEYQIFDLVHRESVLFNGNNIIKANDLTSLNLDPGIYRISSNNLSALAHYKLNYYDFHAYYYDKAERMVAYLPPLGNDNTYSPAANEFNYYKEKKFNNVGNGSSWGFDPTGSFPKRLVIDNLKTEVSDDIMFSNVVFSLDMPVRKFGKPYIGSPSRLNFHGGEVLSPAEINWNDFTILGTTDYADELPIYEGFSNNLRTPTYVEDMLVFDEAITAANQSEKWDIALQYVSSGSGGGGSVACPNWPYEKGFAISYRVYSNYAADANGNLVSTADICQYGQISALKELGVNGEWVFSTIEDNKEKKGAFSNQHLVGPYHGNNVHTIYIEIINVQPLKRTTSSFFDQVANQMRYCSWAVPHEDYSGVENILASFNISQYQIPQKPKHTMVSNYQYNSSGQLLASESVDEGKVEFVYASDGKIRFSQTAQQLLESKFSYTHYDEKNRVVESGVYNSGPTPLRFQNHEESHNIGTSTSVLLLKDNLGSLGFIESYCQDRNFVEYDQPDLSFSTNTGLSNTTYNTTYLNGRVSKTYSGEMNGNTLIVNTSTWYSYDYQGRLRWMVKKINGLPDVQTFDYFYDKNGAVELIEINKSRTTDDYYIKYTYDHSGSLYLTETSTDGLNYKVHEKYEYYQHGPLKRKQIGGHLQGLDYVYTINGQLKSINHPSLTKYGSQAHNFDPGKDGFSSYSTTAPDAFGFSLDYFTGDYKRKGTYIESTGGSVTGGEYYNGRIKSTRWNYSALNYPNGASNRSDHWFEEYLYNTKGSFLSSRAGQFKGYGRENDIYGTNSPTAQASIDLSGNNPSENYLNYDANGNILGLRREASLVVAPPAGRIDWMTYVYQTDANGKRINNKLDHIIDPHYYSALGDVENQAPGNYEYDASGHMVLDVKTNNRKYEYNAAGRITAIYDNNDMSRPILKNYYDEKGMRYKKESFAETSPNTFTLVTESYYLYDAGNAMIRSFTKEIGTHSQPVPIKTMGYGMSLYGETDFSTNKTTYFLKDHLGNVRAQVSKNGNSQMSFSTSFEGTGADDLFWGCENTMSLNIPHVTNRGVKLELGNGDINTLGEFAQGPGIAIPVVNGQTVNSTIKFGDATGNYNNISAGIMYELYNDEHKLLNRDAPSLWVSFSNTFGNQYTVSSNESGLYVVVKPVTFTNAVVYCDDMQVSLSADASGKSGKYLVTVEAYQDYYPFGWPVPGRSLNTSEFDRGYQGVYAMRDAETGLNHFESRQWDARLARWTSPDPAHQFASPYLGMGNNPLKYTDPSGEIIFTAATLIAAPFTGGASLALLPMAIGADLGMWQGGTLANGAANPLQWDYSSGKTWGYMAGGAAIGAASGGAANAVATSGMAFANTAAIVTGSYINSVGMDLLLGGQTDVSVGFGFGSYNLSTDEFGYLGKKGNSALENVGYSLGALANASDVLTGFNPSDVQLNTEKSDAFGHTAITKVGETNSYNSLVSVGPDHGGKWILNPFKFKNGTNNWKNYVNAGDDVMKATVKGVNFKTLSKYGAYLDKGVNYNLYCSSCVSHAARALTISGVPAVGIHPFILHSQMVLRSLGVRPMLYSNYFYQY
ncbi:MAG: RHS repeat-associated core domain-containing protein [Flavobacteriales bacterium]|nr:RHS repeat-associated core domain-containing protein [Flavobacteriales bacterium]